MIWKLGYWCHENIRSKLFWQTWWWFGYHGVYDFMWWAKAHKFNFAQPFGEGYPRDKNRPLNDRS